MRKAISSYSPAERKLLHKIGQASTLAKTMHESELTEDFVRELTANQNRLYAYIFSLLGKHAHASDVLQETNLVLWRKIDQFDGSKPFLPWAFAIARFQVLAFLRDRKRERMLLDPELIELVADQAAQESTCLESTRQSLRSCLGKLSPKSQELIRGRYFSSLTIEQLSKSVSRTAGATKVALLRARRQLAKCIEQQLASES